MIYMSESKYNAKMKKIKESNLSKERKRMLREERMKYWPKVQLPTTSKLVLIVAVLLCVEIIAFCQYIMIVTLDTSALYTMVGAATTMIPIVLGYFTKSKAENTRGGITYDMAMSQMQEQNLDSSEGTEEAVG